ncbi:hypothetical protein BDK92_6247 [Micromonospora pisi]|uniref:Uncharacterized protein n=1 Tax=Micromonospora pisi TaxID=589240 RepID=A0A495JS61_9ACTN|nr:hypothetical protein [Micromonospora pisi]RKR91826.1 hypothetical protein BDK92_6247 [Micromonospora pisi]
MIGNYRELFAAVRKRPHMYMPRGDFASLVAFVEGCNHGNDFNLLTGLQKWLVTRVGCGNNVVWWHLVLRLTDPEGATSLGDMDPETDARAIETLFQCLDDFLALRQEHDGLSRIHAAHQAWLDARDLNHCLASGAQACPVVDWPKPHAGDRRGPSTGQ